MRHGRQQSVLSRTPARRAQVLALLAAATAILAAPSTASAQVKGGIPKSEFVGLVSEDALKAGDAEQRSIVGSQGGLGVGFLRQTFTWKDIEVAPGQFNFGYYDRFVGAAALSGIKILPVLFDPPAFRSKRPASGGERGTYPPTSNDEFARFAAQLVARYGPNGTFWAQNPGIRKLPIRAWQVWNEPNLPVYWRPKPDARAYVAMLRSAFQAIKRLDPDAEVVTAGLPPSQSKGAVPLETYIATMYRNGAKAAFDTLALNPYGATSKEVLRRTKAMRALMRRLKDAKAPIWVTELGWADKGPKSRYTVGAAGQSTRIRDTIKGLWSQRKRLRVRGVVYFAWRDAPPYLGGVDFWGLHTGLLDINGNPKPALQAFRGAVRSLR